MHRMLPPILTIAALVAPYAMAQSHCVEGLQSGVYDFIRSSVSTADAQTIHNELCAAYNRYQVDRSAGSAKASYGAFEGGASFSQEQIESLGKLMCRSDFSDATASQVQEYASSKVSPWALTAYKRCLELHTKGLKVEFSLRKDDQGSFTLSVSYLTNREDRPKLTGLQVVPVDEFDCKGGLWEAAKSGTFPTIDQTLAMVCERKIYNEGKLVGLRPVIALPATVQLVTEEQAIKYDLPAVPLPASADQLSELRKQILPVGALVLFLGQCPQHYFQDVTAEYDGRLLFAAAEVADDALLVEGDGSHTHDASHSHTVAGNIHKPGDSGFREGTGGRRSAGVRWPIRGTAQRTEIQLRGGPHRHKAAGFRLCRKVVGG